MTEIVKTLNELIWRVLKEMNGGSLTASMVHEEMSLRSRARDVEGFPQSQTINNADNLLRDVTKSFLLNSLIKSTSYDVYGCFSNSENVPSRVYATASDVT